MTLTRPHSQNNVSECHYSNNPYNGWSSLENKKKAASGIYFLESVFSGFYEKGNYTPPTCYYRIPSTRHTMMVHFGNGMLTMSEFKPSRDTAYAWDKNNCASNNPYLCPMIQVPEISLRMSIYDPNNKNPFIYRLFLYTYNTSGKNSLTYTQLKGICGVSSNCIIDIGSCDATGNKCNHLGSVDLDISNDNLVKINQINNDVVNILGFDHSFKQLKPFNIIY